MTWNSKKLLVLSDRDAARLAELQPRLSKLPAPSMTRSENHLLSLDVRGWFGSAIQNGRDILSQIGRASCRERV